jgi:multiple antibiotic resistance protein
MDTLAQTRPHTVHVNFLMARKVYLYVLLLMFFFLVFGNLLLRLFDVPLSMVRVVGGVILMRIGFELFAPSVNSNLVPSGGAAGH